MRDLDTISSELFDKIRGRFPSATLGDEDGKITNQPSKARFFDFAYSPADSDSKVTISIDSEDGITVMFNSELIGYDSELKKKEWYDFLKELRKFSRKRLLKFDTRDIEISNLKRRDFEYLAANKGSNSVNESKMYGTSKVSYQDIGNARLRLNHSQSVNAEIPASRTQHVESIFIESNAGERFKYPYKHIAGARAMANHVAHGGVPHDTFGKHITGMSEELSKLRKFKNYMGRSSVMAEGLGEYMGVIKERVADIKKKLNKLQRESFYKREFENFSESSLTEVPEDVQEDWIAQLTVNQFNEELKDVFPYIYKLIGENSIKEINVDKVGESNYPDGMDWKAFDQATGRYNDNVDDEIEDEIFELKDNVKADVLNIVDYKEILTGGYSTREILDSLDDEVSDICYKYTQKISDRTSDTVHKKLVAYGKKVAIAKIKQLKASGEINKAPREDAGDNKEQISMPDYILSMFDRQEAKFPKGRTAVLTAIEKDYGDEFIEPAKKFIDMIIDKFTDRSHHTEECSCDHSDDNDTVTDELSRIKALANHNK